MSDKIGLRAGPYRKGPEVEDTPTGRYSSWVYEGSLAECERQRDIERINGASYVTLRPKGDGFYELTSRYPWGEKGEAASANEYQDQHELEIETGQPSWAQNAILRGQLSEANIGKVARIVTEYETGEKTPSEAETAATAISATALAAFKMVAYRKTDSFIEYRSTYRRTITAATPRQVKASYVGAGKIWTTAEVQAFEGIPSGHWFQLPSGSQWLKSPPHVVTVGGLKTQISYYYTECKQASALLYQAYGSATLLDS